MQGFAVSAPAAVEVRRVTRPWVEGVGTGSVLSIDAGLNDSTCDGLNPWTDDDHGLSDSVDDGNPIHRPREPTRYGRAGPDYALDVTRSVAASAAGQANHGLLLRLADEARLPEQLFAFWSRESDKRALRLRIDYTPAAVEGGGGGPGEEKASVWAGRDMVRAGQVVHSQFDAVGLRVAPAAAVQETRRGWRGFRKREARAARDMAAGLAMASAASCGWPRGRVANSMGVSSAAVALGMGAARDGSGGGGPRSEGGARRLIVHSHLVAIGLGLAPAAAVHVWAERGRPSRNEAVGLGLAPAAVQSGEARAAIKKRGRRDRSRAGSGGGAGKKGRGRAREVWKCGGREWGGQADVSQQGRGSQSLLHGWDRVKQKQISSVGLGLAPAAAAQTERARTAIKTRGWRGRSGGGSGGGGRMAGKLR